MEPGQEREPGAGNVWEELSPLQAPPGILRDVLLVSWEEKGKDPGGTKFPLSINSSLWVPPCLFCIINSPLGWNKL